MMEEVKLNDTIAMLVNHFNLQSGMRYRFGTEATRDAIKNVIDASGGDLADVREFFKVFAKTNKNIYEACDAYVHSKKQDAKVQQKQEQQPVVVQSTESKAAGAMDLMGQVMVELLAKTKIADVEAEMVKRLEDQMRKFMLDNYGPVQRKIDLDISGKKVQIGGVLHKKFDDLVKYVNADIPVFLVGPAGSGKNVLCKQVADALQLPFYFSNSVTQEYKITGFTDAMGHFHESQFYKAFKNGGLFMLDEVDASIPEVLVILNAAIANRYFDFPAPIGYVEAHPNFRVVAAGNTFGQGADYDYVGRNQLDAATLNRFHQIMIDYDPKIEEACAMGDVELLAFCRKFRAATKKAGIRVVVSYRNIQMIAKMAGCVSLESALDGSLIKSLDSGDMDTIRADVAGCGKYSAAFDKLLKERKGWK